MENKVRVLIVDDHSMVRKGLRVLLDGYDDIEVVAEASDGQYAIDICRQQPVDVVLMDMLMPVVNGIQATQQLLKSSPGIKVIALTSLDDEDTVQGALKAGAMGYLMKDISGDELAEAIRKASIGQSTLSPQAAHVLIQATTRPPAVGHDLTEREREVLALMIEGMSNREIGETLVISSSTVKNHVSNILSKLGTSSRTQAVAFAVEHKLIN